MLELRPGTRLVQRYTLEALLGAGAESTVWRAADDTLGQSVAIKVLKLGPGGFGVTELWRVRREIALLRHAQLSGVVRLHDEWVDVENRLAFLAMALVEGSRFPGTTERSWAALASRATRLFEILAEVHGAGLVHRDIKPDNVLVTPCGEVWLVDFGLSVGHPVSDDGRRISVGTPRYQAPEQMAGTAAGPRADLYAAGVMLFEALAGKAPFDANSPHALRRAKLTTRAPSIREFVPALPARIADLVDGLLAFDPCERPPSALAVLRHLRGEEVERWSLPSELRELPVIDQARLEALFAGPERVFRLKSGAAHVLWGRSAGNPPTVERAIRAWLGSGAARLDVTGRLVLDASLVERSLTGGSVVPPEPVGQAFEALDAQTRRVLLAIDLAEGEATRPLLEAVLPDIEVAPALDALVAHGSVQLGSARRWIAQVRAARTGARDSEVAELARALACRLPAGSAARFRLALHFGDPGALLTEALALSALQLEAGAHSLADNVLRETSALVRDTIGAEEAAALYERWLEVANAGSTPEYLSRLLYEIARSPHVATPRLARIATLAEGCLGASRDGGERWFAMLDELGELDDEMLERIRLSAMVRAAFRARLGARLDDAVERIAAASAACQNTSFQGTLLIARGLRHYARGDYLRAGRMGEAAAALEPERVQGDALLDAASSYLEAFAFDRVDAVVQRMLAGEGFGSPARLLRAEHILRRAHYRQARAMEIDDDLVQMCARVGLPWREARILTTEAAVALRTGAWTRGAALAELAAERLRELRAEPLARLPEALGLVLRGDEVPPRRIAEIVACAREAPAHVGMEVIGLVAMISPLRAPAWREHVEASRAAIAPEHRDFRLEVLSVREIERAFAAPATATRDWLKAC